MKSAIRTFSLGSVMVLVAVLFVFGGASVANADKYDTGWYDEYEYYTPDTGWYDSYDYYTPDTGWYDDYEYYTYDTGWYDDYEYYTPSYEYDNYGYDYVYDDYGYGDDYWYDYGCGSSCYSYSTPTYTTPGCSFCGGSTPRYVPPTSGSNAYSSYSNVVTNTNTNVNNITNIDNSINDSFNNYNSGNTSIVVAQPQTPVVYTPPVIPAPYCTINQAQYGGYGSSAYLSWTSTNATTAYLSNVGSVAVSGSQTVYPHGTVVYTLTVYGQNGQSATCATTVYGQTYVPPTYNPPYVSLTQIPYTGFDFGPIGNAMYWAGLLGFAMAGAYLMVYYRGGAMTLATAMVGARKPLPPVVAPKAPILVEREAAEAQVAPIVASLRKAVGTSDTMAIVQSKDGSMPKIVIERN